MDVIEEVKTANEDRGTRYENLLLFVGAKLVASVSLKIKHFLHRKHRRFQINEHLTSQNLSPLVITSFGSPRVAFKSEENKGKRKTASLKIGIYTYFKPAFFTKICSYAPSEFFFWFSRFLFKWFYLSEVNGKDEDLSASKPWMPWEWKIQNGSALPEES